MYKKKLPTWLRSLFVLGLVLTLILGNGGDALAARRTGGRIGGGSFSSPSRTQPSGGGTRSPGYGGGGGFGFPFLLPFFGFGGGFGGLFTILILISIANFLVNSFRNAADGGENHNNLQVAVGKVQVGLLASARELQKELDDLARTADTGTASGRALVLQEATLALLRHPEYWVYGATESQKTALEAAEAKFNQLSLEERSKFSEETLSNYNNQLRGRESSSNLVKTDENGGEYIIVTIIVGATGKLELPAINNSENMRSALQQIGGIGSDRLLAIEVLWTPQAPGDTLTTDDILAEYPNLKLV
ncbi:MAG: DUF1517 domain-containing protein [Gomphosphaeria aponina SAG 52.96 = DSM 107014]|uniref:DUF1517 domain-containing protein n=1 Tax=Gomphosphaeria aponina SAG 52.96 = DSM 107014 TaxID=1521640 RepID=A0A941JPU7_9CHRO|nr:DUF1517 domain-containing protein [Gomphosphaeria aponina SAG 52.96 = DSM 107014]